MQFKNIKNGTFVLGDCLEVMKTIPDNYFDMIITSPPYDNLRNYTNDLEWTFESFKKIAKELFRVCKEGASLVWIVNDEKIKGCESLTSFKQCIEFVNIGFNLNDSMIWNKGGFSAVGALKTQYAPVFEFMFVFCKGKLKTFNPLKDRENKHKGKLIQKTKRQIDGTTIKGKSYISSDFGQRFNVWEIAPQRQKGDDKHPAPFPINLIEDHVKSWSNENDMILDCFAGSGTTAIACENTNRKWVCIEISEKYANLAVDRILKHEVENV